MHKKYTANYLDMNIHVWRCFVSCHRKRGSSEGGGSGFGDGGRRELGAAALHPSTHPHPLSTTTTIGPTILHLQPPTW